jgi:hypothetical protein
MNFAGRRASMFGLLIVLAITVGCGQPDFYTCDGTVTLDGKPIGKLQITFAPDNPDDRPPIALTDEAGKFQMSTGSAMGVKPGNYKVVIEDPGAADGRKTSTEPDYVYVVGRYSGDKTDLTYTADRHQSDYQISLKKE